MAYRKPSCTPEEIIDMIEELKRLGYSDRWINLKRVIHMVQVRRGDAKGALAERFIIRFQRQMGAIGCVLIFGVFLSASFPS